MSKPTSLRFTAFPPLAVGVLAAACAQDLTLPMSDLPPPDGGSSGQAQLSAKGGHGGSAASAGAGGRLGMAGASGSKAAAAGSAGQPDGAAAGVSGAPPAGAGGSDAGSGSSSGAAGRAFGGGGSSAAGGGAAGGEQTGMSGAAGEGATPAQPALLFSEYVEGSGTFKALEILALRAGSLEGCSVDLYFNGNLEASASHALHGSLQSGVVTLCSSSLATEQPSACAQIVNLNFNGDDAVALACNGEVLDIIGQIGVDPGSYWGDVARTADRTLRRRCDVQAGDRNGFDPFDPALEWQAFPIDTFDGLGAVSCEN